MADLRVRFGNLTAATASQLSPEDLFYCFTGRLPSEDASPGFHPLSEAVTGGPCNFSTLPGSKLQEPGGVWDDRAETCFLFCLAHIPAIERQKILFFGKACGRNEVIALIVTLATGVLRGRKQVSSHSQVVKNKRAAHPILNEVFNAPVGIGPEDREGTVGSAVALRFHPVLYQYMGLPTTVDLASAHKPAWLDALTAQDGSSASLGAHRGDSGSRDHGRRSTRDSTSGARRISIAESSHAVEPQVSRSTRLLSSRSQWRQGSAHPQPSGLGIFGAISSDDSSLSDAASPELEGHFTLQAISIDFQAPVVGLCGSLMTHHSVVSDVGASDIPTIPLVANRYLKLADELSAGHIVEHVQIRLRHHITDKSNLCHTRICLKVGGQGCEAPELFLYTTCGFNCDEIGSSRQAVSGQTSSCGEWSSLFTSALGDFDAILRSDEALEDLILPHLWLTQRFVKNCPEQVEQEPCASRPGNTVLLLIYTFVYDRT